MELDITQHGGPYGGGKYRKNSLIPYTALGFPAPISRQTSLTSHSGSMRGFATNPAGEMFLLLEGKIVKYNSEGVQVATLDRAYLMSLFWDEASQTLFVVTAPSYNSSGLIYAYTNNLVQKGTSLDLYRGMYDVYVRSGTIYVLTYDYIYKLTFNGSTFSQVSSGAIANSRVAASGASIVVSPAGDVFVTVDSSGGGNPTLQRYNNALTYQYQQMGWRLDKLLVDSQGKLYQAGYKLTPGVSSFTTDWSWNGASAFGMFLHEATNTVLAFAYGTGLAKLNMAGALQWLAADLPTEVVNSNSPNLTLVVQNLAAKNPFIALNSAGNQRIRAVLEFCKLYA
jgi:hypothetical protein